MNRVEYVSYLRPREGFTAVFRYLEGHDFHIWREKSFERILSEGRILDLTSVRDFICAFDLIPRGVGYFTSFVLFAAKGSRLEQVLNSFDPLVLRPEEKLDLPLIIDVAKTNYSLE